MALEVLHDGYLRRITVFAPADWMTEVENGNALMMLVFMCDGRISNRKVPGSDDIPGMSTWTGVSGQLYPLIGDLTWIDPASGLYPKYIAVFVEGIDPTEQSGREVRGFSHPLEPHDHGTIEWMYPWPKTSEVALLEQAAFNVGAQLTETWTGWYGAPPPTIYGTAVHPGKVFLVAQGRACNMALSALKSPMFSGAALVPGSIGGTAGGKKTTNFFARNAFVFDLPTPLLARRGKAIFAICGDRGRLGGLGDNAWVQYPAPSPSSQADLLANGDSAWVYEDMRSEYSVIGSLRPWWLWMGLPDPPGPGGGSQPAGVLEAVTTTGDPADGTVQLWFDAALGDNWPTAAGIAPTASYEGITEIYKFFQAFGPHS